MVPGHCFMKRQRRQRIKRPFVERIGIHPIFAAARGIKRRPGIAACGVVWRQHGWYGLNPIRLARQLAEEAGLECGNGIIVDEDSRTSDERIYAIGDCSMRPLQGQPQKLRLESVPNAIDQADIVAAHILGAERPGYNPPWFWSDQYDTKIQTAGLFTGHTHTVVRGDIEAGRFAVFYFEGDRFIAVDAINDPQSFMAGKQVLKLSIPLKRHHLEETDEPMMSIVKKLQQK